MLKKIICLITVLVIVFSFSGCSDSEFLVHGKDDLSTLLNMSEGELDAYCKDNNITYLAVNRDNTKQIKRIEYEDEFSKKVKDFYLFSDYTIWSMVPEISGFSDASGRLVYIGDDYKLLKTEQKTKDSGGEYVITQFVTVKNSKKIILSFCTAADTDRSYIEDILEEQFPEIRKYLPVILGGIGILFIIGYFVLVVIEQKCSKKD